MSAPKIYDIQLVINSIEVEGNVAKVRSMPYSTVQDKIHFKVVSTGAMCRMLWDPDVLRDSRRVCNSYEHAKIDYIKIHS